MPTSSAEPARLEAYPGQLTSANDQLTTLASDLDSAMQAFARGAGTGWPSTEPSSISISATGRSRRSSKP